jgi:hypothetical protein
MSPRRRRRLKVLLIVVTLAIFVTPASATTEREPQHDLALEARRVALHGGITGSCYGCATPLMKKLMRQVYRARFKSRGSETAVCLMMAESGGNPGAVSSGGDHGGPQMNRSAHGRAHPEWWRPGRGFRYLIFDPWYGASEMWAMSGGGRWWTAWTGTYGRGMCRGLN